MKQLRSQAIGLLVLLICSGVIIAQGGGGEKTNPVKRPTSDKETVKLPPKNVPPKPITRSPAKPPNPPASLRSFDFITVTLDSSGNLKSRDRKSAYAFTE